MENICFFWGGTPKNRHTLVEDANLRPSCQVELTPVGPYEAPMFASNGHRKDPSKWVST